MGIARVVDMLTKETKHDYQHDEHFYVFISLFLIFFEFSDVSQSI